METTQHIDTTEAAPVIETESPEALESENPVTHTEVPPEDYDAPEAASIPDLYTGSEGEDAELLASAEVAGNESAAEIGSDAIETAPPSDSEAEPETLDSESESQSEITSALEIQSDAEPVSVSEAEVLEHAEAAGEDLAPLNLDEAATDENNESELATESEPKSEAFFATSELVVPEDLAQPSEPVSEAEIFTDPQTASELEAASISETDNETDPATAEGAILAGSVAKFAPEVLQSSIEAILFTSDKSVSVARLREVFGEDGPSEDEICSALDALVARFHAPQYGIELRSAQGGYHFVTKAENAELVRKFHASKPFRLGKSALETMAIIAYRQPVTRAEIDQIRGIDSSHLMRTLIERGLVKMAGKADVPGRPVQYGTTERFLEILGLKDLSELPPLSELEQLQGSVEDPARKVEQGLERFMETDIRPVG